MRWTGFIVAVFLLGWSWTMGAFLPAFASSVKMKSPGAKSRIHAPAGEQIHTSNVRLACLGGLKFYQKWISPAGGGRRCGFSPSCSDYATKATEEQGSAIGILMTADRLIRCNPWKTPGPDYTPLPNGRLYDPPSKNLLFQP
jgi:putative membrane protein insertion efficiency factor